MLLPQPRAPEVHIVPSHPVFRFDEVLLQQHDHDRPNASTDGLRIDPVVPGGDLEPSPMPSLPSPTMQAYEMGHYDAPTDAQPEVPASCPDMCAYRERYDDLLDRIDDRRWELRIEREKLHGVRVRLRNQRQELSTTREKAAVQAATAFDLLKRYLLERDVEVPQNIRYAIEDADIWRNRLGGQELEFQQAEEKYNLDEWTYTEKEKQAVDTLFESTTPPASAPSAPPDTQVLTQFSFGLSEVEADTPIPELASSPDDVLDTEEPPSQRKPELAADEPSTGETPTTRNRVVTSVSLGNIPKQLLERVQPIARPYSENDLTQVRLNWTNTRGRIEGWLLDALENSSLQKAQLRNVLSSDTLDYDNWWQLVLQHWKSDSPSSTAFHTGDTTASLTTSSQLVSVITLQELLDETGRSSPEARPSSASPLVFADRVVDALDEVDFPLHIKSSDLFESTSKHVAFEARSPSSPSMSTQLTTVTRASSRLDCSSMSSIEEDQSRTPSTDTESFRQVHRSSHARSPNENRLGITLNYSGNNPRSSIISACLS